MPCVCVCARARVCVCLCEQPNPGFCSQLVMWGRRLAAARSQSLQSSLSYTPRIFRCVRSPSLACVRITRARTRRHTHTHKTHSTRAHMHMFKVCKARAHKDEHTEWTTIIRRTKRQGSLPCRCSAAKMFHVIYVRCALLQVRNVLVPAPSGGEQRPNAAALVIGSRLHHRLARVRLCLARRSV